VYDDLTELGPTESRHLRDLAKAWASYGPALREWSSLDGGMQWKTVNGADYLCRYRPDPDTGKKKFISLGRRSAETEATYRDFIGRRDAARQTVLAGRDDIALAGRIAKAHGLARMPAKHAEIVRAFWRASLDRHLTLCSGAAMFAYEVKTEILTPAALTRDDNLLFLFDGSSDFTTGDIGEAYEDATGAKADVSRRQGRFIIRSDDAPGVEILSRKFLLEQVKDGDQAEALRLAFQMDVVRGLTVARNAQPVEITAPDPRLYALLAHVEQDEEIWAKRARFTATLVRERWPQKFDHRQEEAFPDLCGDPEDWQRFSGP
jgi:hypothetical protein